MKTHGVGRFVLSVLIVTGCGYNPKSPTSPANPDSAISSSGEAGGTSPDLGGKLDTGAAADVSGDVARDGQSVSDGAGGTAGTTGTATTTGAAGTTGGGGALAGATADTGGTTGAGGTTATATTSAGGGSTANPDASPDLPTDLPVIVTCPSPKTPSNGNVSAPSLAVGAEATYTCGTGYSPTVTKRTCQGDGTWTGAEALCNPVDCGTPPVIANSKVSAPSTTYTASASYTCDPGYTPSSSAVVTCQATGRWSTSTLACNPVDCGPPSVAADIDASAPVTTFGSIATYTCKPGGAITAARARWPAPSA